MEACIFLCKRPVLQDKCQSGLTEGTVWDNTLAMAPVLIHASKEPDGEVKVSVQILFLEWGVYSLSLWSSPVHVPLSVSHIQFSTLLRYRCVAIRSSHRGPLIQSTVLIGIELAQRVTHLSPSSIRGLNAIACNLSSVSDCERWFQNRHFKIVRLMKTMVGLIWVLFRNQQSCPETPDKQRLSFCLGCGAERYVLSGDCAPRPPLILRGRTHTERPCAETERAGRTCRRQLTPCCWRNKVLIRLPIRTHPPQLASVFSDSHSLAEKQRGDLLQTAVAPHKSRHKPVSEFLLIMTLIFCWWFNWSNNNNKTGQKKWRSASTRPSLSIFRSLLQVIVVGRAPKLLLYSVFLDPATLSESHKQSGVWSPATPPTRRKWTDSLSQFLEKWRNDVPNNNSWPCTFTCQSGRFD